MDEGSLSEELPARGILGHGPAVGEIGIALQPLGRGEGQVIEQRLIVKDEYRRQGIGKKLVDFIVRNAQQEGYRELSIGVDLDNDPALRLYTQMGFDRIVHIGEDEYGRFVKLIKEL